MIIFLAHSLAQAYINVNASTTQAWIATVAFDL